MNTKMLSLELERLRLHMLAYVDVAKAVVQRNHRKKHASGRLSLTQCTTVLDLYGSFVCD